MGIVVLLYKGTGDLEDLNNYRGITLLFVLSKVLEGVVKNRLVKWATRKGLIADEQGGFRAKRGSPELVWAVEEIVRRRSAEGKRTVCAFLDVRKAYDTVWWGGLWWKLWGIGAQGKLGRVVEKMYRHVESAVVCQEGLTDWFA
jgi:hypothetical protein